MHRWLRARKISEPTLHPALPKAAIRLFGRSCKRIGGDLNRLAMSWKLTSRFLHANRHLLRWKTLSFELAEYPSAPE
jgi:hypothetical protein